jgi:hypothetical protein
VGENRLCDLIADTRQRIERAEWFLKDHGNSAAAQPTHRGFVGGCDVVALEANGA